MVLALLGAILPGSALAHISSIDGHDHEPGSFYTAVSFGAERIDLLYTAPAASLQREGIASPEDAAAHVASLFEIHSNGESCAARIIGAAPYGAIDAWQFELTYECKPGTIDIRYTAPVDDAFHRNRLELQLGPHVSFDEFDRLQSAITLSIDDVLWAQGWEMPLEPAPLAGRVPAITDYFRMGFDHVLNGWDHLAFLIGLLVVVSRLGSLLLLITSFTVAHSITLAMSATDVFTLNVALTEAAIAVTIIWIGVENLIQLWRRSETAMVRRWSTTLLFGLIHGFGFSFLLREIGLPPDEFVPALLMFNLGVEVAQIVVVVVPFLAAQYLLRRLPQWNIFAGIVSAGVMLSGAWWLIERTAL